MGRALTNCALGACLLALAVSEASAVTVVVGAAQDNTLYQNALGALSNGAGEHLFAGSTGGGDLRRGLIAFDVAGTVPAGATITSVSLTLYMSRSISGVQDVSLHEVQAGWGEGTSDAGGNEGSGAASTPGDATWIHGFYDTDAWASAGGDFDPLASATESIGDIGSYTWDSTAAMVADVQGWLDNPSASYGWLLMGNEVDAGSAKRFDTKENIEPSFRPSLTVEYVPEPASLALLGLGAVASLCHRKRR